MSEPALTPERLRQRLRELKEQRGAEYRLLALGYFGSYARNEATAESGGHRVRHRRAQPVPHVPPVAGSPGMAGPACGLGAIAGPGQSPPKSPRRTRGGLCMTGTCSSRGWRPKLEALERIPRRFQGISRPAE